MRNIVLIIITALSLSACVANKNQPNLANASEGTKLKLPKDFLELSEANYIPQITKPNGELIDTPIPPDYQQ